jgi:hypothetical protein
MRSKGCRLAGSAVEDPQKIAGLQEIFCNGQPHIARSDKTERCLHGYLFAKRWWSLSAFRSTGFNRRFVQSAGARKLACLAMAMPKSFWGTQLSGYFLQVPPAAKPKPAAGKPATAGKGAQTGFTLARNFKRL